MQQTGLKDEILDRLGIHIPLHRTILQSFGCRLFTNDIEIGKHTLPQISYDNFPRQMSLFIYFTVYPLSQQSS